MVINSKKNIAKNCIHCSYILFPFFSHLIQRVSSPVPLCMGRQLTYPRNCLMFLQRCLLTYPREWFNSWRKCQTRDGNRLPQRTSQNFPNLPHSSKQLYWLYWLLSCWILGQNICHANQFPIRVFYLRRRRQKQVQECSHSVRLSVRPSVCLSVRPSQNLVITTPLKLLIQLS